VKPTSERTSGLRRSDDERQKKNDLKGMRQGMLL
jgi:hypothetical protein